MKKVLLTLLMGLFFVAFSNAQSIKPVKEEVKKEIKKTDEASTNTADAVINTATQEKSCCKGKKGKAECKGKMEGKSCKGKKEGKSCKGKNKAECKGKKEERKKN